MSTPENPTPPAPPTPESLIPQLLEQEAQLAARARELLELRGQIEAELDAIRDQRNGIAHTLQVFEAMGHQVARPKPQGRRKGGR